MRNTQTPLGLLLLFLAFSACTAGSDPSRLREVLSAASRVEATREPSSGNASVRAEPAVAARLDDAGSASTQLGRGQGSASADLSGLERSFWNDPDFLRRFNESYLAVSDVEPSISLIESNLMQAVQLLLGEDRVAEAVELLRSKTGPSTSALIDFFLGNLHYQCEEYDDAISAYTLAIEKFSTFLRAWKNLGLIRMRRGEFEQAARCLTRVIGLGGNDPDVYGLLGIAQGRQNHHIASESAFRMATLLDPDKNEWRSGLAVSFFEQQRYADAAAYTETLIHEDPDNAELWLLQANAFIGLEKPLRAAENFELVDRMGKSTSDSLRTLADIYLNEELFDLGVDTYLRAMDLAPGADPAPVLRAAQFLNARGALADSRRLADGIEHILGGYLDAEGQKDLLKLRARLAVAAGAGDEEAAVLERVIELDPLDGDALILLGMHASKAQDHEQAIFYFERAAEIEGYEADALVRHAQLLARRQEYKEALALLRRAQQFRPRDSVQRYLEDIQRISQAR